MNIAQEESNFIAINISHLHLLMFYDAEYLISGIPFLINLILKKERKTFPETCKSSFFRLKLSRDSLN